MIEELHDTIGLGVEFALADVHTIVVAKITSVNDKTISCVPVINRVVKGSSKQLPEFIEVPPVILQGGDSYIAEPIAAGDYCLILISERCYDAWYAGSDFVSPLEMRMHDYSDGFALCGVNPSSTAITIPKKNRLIKGVSDHDGDLNVTGNITQEGGVSTLAECVVNGLMKYGSVETAGKQGVTGSFRSEDGKTITVTNGIITGIS
ncbi:Gp138 family membrane-puncturing spike protein [Kluyvera cryocrescens]|uniref:Gp138 family membrane-puncturing spike protein n=1 Tax=Kluyvera cryocrescens TaxID=580 RepID=UPI0039F55B98